MPAINYIYFTLKIVLLTYRTIFRFFIWKNPENGYAGVPFSSSPVFHLRMDNQTYSALSPHCNLVFSYENQKKLDRNCCVFREFF